MVDFWANHLNVPTAGPGTLGRRRLVPRGTSSAPTRSASSPTCSLAAGAPPGHAALPHRRAVDARTRSTRTYGRELLELHTVGVASGYTEDDVRNSAYILTGRTVSSEPGRPGRRAPSATTPAHALGRPGVGARLRRTPTPTPDGRPRRRRRLPAPPGRPPGHRADRSRRKLAVRFVSDIAAQDAGRPPGRPTYLEAGHGHRARARRCCSARPSSGPRSGRRPAGPLENVAASVRVLGEPVPEGDPRTGPALSPVGHDGRQPAARVAGAQRLPRRARRLALGQRPARLLELHRALVTGQDELPPGPTRGAGRRRPRTVGRLRRQPVPAPVPPGVPAGAPRRARRLPRRRRGRARRRDDLAAARRSCPRARLALLRRCDEEHRPDRRRTRPTAPSTTPSGPARRASRRPACDSPGSARPWPTGRSSRRGPGGGRRRAPPAGRLEPGFTRRRFLAGAGIGGRRRPGRARSSPPARRSASPAARARWSSCSSGAAWTGCRSWSPPTTPTWPTARPRIAVPAGALLPLDRGFGLHPALAPLHPLWGRRQLHGRARRLDARRVAQPLPGPGLPRAGRIVHRHRRGLARPGARHAGPRHDVPQPDHRNDRRPGAGRRPAAPVDRPASTGSGSEAARARSPSADDRGPVGAVHGVRPPARPRTSPPRSTASASPPWLVGRRTHQRRPVPRRRVRRAAGRARPADQGRTSALRVACVDVGGWDMHTNLGTVDGGRHEDRAHASSASRSAPSPATSATG